MPGTNKPSDLDSAVRVVVTPSQSSYFAGEPFSVTITFTNTRSPESVPSRAFSASHKRGAHSISSAPLARPPTSPGNPRTALPTIPIPVQNGADKFDRKGLIGRQKGPNDFPQLLEDSRKRFLARSMSVDITPLELDGQGPRLSHKSTQLNQNYEHLTDPSVPTFMRSPSLPLSPSHPHARKNSVLDGQLQLRDMSQSLPTSPYPMSASTSTFSLALDPIAEITSSPYPPTPLFASPTPNEPLSPTTNSYPPRSSQGHGRRPSQLGLGQPPHSSNPNLSIIPRTAFSSTFPQTNTELILYSYAQLAGTLVLTPLPGTTVTQDQVHTLNRLRSGLIRRSVGSGSMDIATSLHQRPQQHKRRPTHSRSSSLSAGLMSLLSSPSSLLTSPSAPTAESTPGSPPKSSVFAGLSPFPSSGSGSRVGLGIGIEDDIDPEKPLPTFEVQPAMLAVDLSLLPGESRSYTYTIPLPANLPPTFRGRSMKFSYELIVGACRAGSPGSAGSNSVSRVMKVPIRVYNNVTVGRLPSPYDMLWPILNKPPDSGSKVIEQVVGLIKSTVRSSALSPTPCGNYDGLQDYAQRLLASFPEQGSGVRIKMPVEPMRSEIERERQEEGSMTGCREAVELLTRNPKKVSYDVNKEGVKVAVLTFTKSAYRLGETVLGVVELNERTGRSRVLKLSASLEAHESLPSSITSSSNSRHLRRVHADHHSSFVLSTLRTAFSLDIPSDASPAFQVKLGANGETDPKLGGLEWKVRLCLLVAVAAESSHTGTEGVRLKSMVRDGRRGEWGSSWKAPPGIAPLEYPNLDSRAKEPPAAPPKTWASFFAAPFLGTLERGYHDGDEEPGDDEDDGAYDGVRGDSEGGVGVGVNFGGKEDDWEEVKVETVECEVPIRVWPGNTAFKAMDVLFEV